MQLLNFLGEVFNENEKRDIRNQGEGYYGFKVVRMLIELSSCFRILWEIVFKSDELGFFEKKYLSSKAFKVLYGFF